MAHALQASKIKLNKVFIQKGAIENEIDAIHQAIDHFNFQVLYDCKFDLENKNARSEISVMIHGFNQEEEKISMASYEIHTYFHIENIEDLYKKNEQGEISIQGALGNALASVTYSTARGIILVRLQGTPLENFLMPVVDPNQLLKRKPIE